MYLSLYCLCLCHCHFLVRECPLITLIKCLKGHKSLGSLSVVFWRLWLLVVPKGARDKVTYWAVVGQLKIPARVKRTNLYSDLPTSYSEEKLLCLTKRAEIGGIHNDVCLHWHLAFRTPPSHTQDGWRCQDLPAQNLLEIETLKSYKNRYFAGGRGRQKCYSDGFSGRMNPAPNIHSIDRRWGGSRNAELRIWKAEPKHYKHHQHYKRKVKTFLTFQRTTAGQINSEEGMGHYCIRVNEKLSWTHVSLAWDPYNICTIYIIGTLPFAR